MSAPIVRETNLSGVRRIAVGKVRDIYAWEGDLLLVATDRLSAFDVVFPGGIPGKGAILTQLSVFWFGRTGGIVPNHLITADFAELPAALRAFPELRHRAMLCKRAEVLPVECIVRGYLEGSGLKEYKASGTVCGIKLPPGLERRSRLPEPIFTPSTKAAQGLHDENITWDQCVGIIGLEMAQKLRDTSLALYNHAHDFLDAKGITLADTKFELGMRGGELLLVDEALTPDSSRFWVKGAVDPKGAPISYDKQYVRDYLEEVGWNKTPPAPQLPEPVVTNTAARYAEVYEKITGERL